MKTTASELARIYSTPANTYIVNTEYKDHIFPKIDEDKLKEQVKNMNTKHQKFSGSLGEFAERYINGETFYQLDASQAYEIPLSIKAVDLKSYYEQCVYELVQPIWYENLGDGVLCWKGCKSSVVLVTNLSVKCDIADAMNGNSYIQNNLDNYYDQFTPLTKEEALRFVWGES